MLSYCRTRSFGSNKIQYNNLPDCTDISHKNVHLSLSLNYHIFQHNIWIPVANKSPNFSHTTDHSMIKKRKESNSFRQPTSYKQFTCEKPWTTQRSFETQQKQRKRLVTSKPFVETCKVGDSMVRCWKNLALSFDHNTPRVQDGGVLLVDWQFSMGGEVATSLETWKRGYADYCEEGRGRDCYICLKFYK